MFLRYKGHEWGHALDSGVCCRYLKQLREGAQESVAECLISAPSVGPTANLNHSCGHSPHTDPRSTQYASCPTPHRSEHFSPAPFPPFCRPVFYNSCLEMPRVTNVEKKAAAASAGGEADAQQNAPAIDRVCASIPLPCMQDMPAFLQTNWRFLRT